MSIFSAKGHKGQLYVTQPGKAGEQVSFCDEADDSNFNCDGEKDT
jgi:hypothetical protein